MGVDGGETWPLVKTRVGGRSSENSDVCPAVGRDKGGRKTKRGPTAEKEKLPGTYR